MKHALAVAIQAAAALLGTWMVGAAVRGPFADKSIPRDLAAGASVVGAAWAVGWSAHELEAKP